MIELKEEKAISKSLAFDYIQKQYSEQDALELTKFCRPILGHSDYQMVINDKNGDSYYLFVTLTREQKLQWVDDLTIDVRNGTSIFPCDK